MQKSNHKKAFSLLELSVVTLIVGLLIVGVSSGTSLVKSARLSAAKSLTLSSQITTIPGMVLWLENSMRDSFVANQAVNNTQVTTWFNREPSGYLTKNNLTTTASANVVYLDKSINNLPALRKTAAGKMSLASFSGGALTTSTIVIVFKATGDISASKNLADSGNTAAGFSCPIGIRSDGIFLSGILLSTPIVQNIPYILIVNYNPGNLTSNQQTTIFLNSTTAVGPSNTPNLTTLDGLTVGTDRHGNYGIDAEIPEIIVYNRTLKNTEIQDVLRYLSKKYKITVTGI